MRGYVLRRLGASILLLALASLLVFALLRVVPGDPTITKLGGARNLDPAALTELRHQLGLDRSVVAQYLSWVGGVARGDLGQSYFSQYAVTTLIGQRIVPTLELAALAFVLGLLLAVPAALVSATRPGSLAARAVDTATAALMAAPPFLVGIAFVIVFGVQAGLLPTRGYVPFVDDPLRNLQLIAMPALTLALAVAAPLVVLLRASLAETLRAPFIRTATGKGLRRRRVVLGHALPNALIPSLTYLGVTVGYLLGGVVVVEYVFGWPGLGSLIVDAVLKRDYAVLQSVVLLAVAIFALVTFVTDVLYGVLDPRLRVGEVNA
ncbi:ABC transporter permease [Conexibacter woesei]|uniref:Binding-protein-dependent transport systems inner membrane component n=1 Tax=Conexibacter woesei (strain DSM 14684 / CCUG 47730 / CIP 108061 / JCM 11494 / NBRC 100937 / ID131577) TaxID=469383 RepID=D3FDD7_CONWI|nr:ABC transporter permease [Conexibacter woesei]ADB53529.1 binding-protein-dependent transport systems inner membrane component [Conexibacter woesei DSM 14684]